MQLWPSALLKHRAFSAHHRLDRPWWRLDESGASCVRRYGGSGPVPYWYECWVRADGLYLVEAPKAVRSLQDEADSVEPIPHPGFRVGQVWARDPGGVNVIDGRGIDLTLPDLSVARTMNTEEGEENLDSGEYWIQQITASRYDVARGCVLWTVAGTTAVTMRTKALKVMFKRAFLLADPCDPGKAPWAPAHEGAP